MTNSEFENLDENLFKPLSDEEMNQAHGGLGAGGASISYATVCDMYTCFPVMVDVVHYT